jgi:hypothetical protein
MATENEVEENLDLPEIIEGEEDTTNWREEAQKLREKAIAQRERTKTLRDQLKEAKALAEKKPESKPESKPDESRLLEKLEKMSLRSAGITSPEDIELARNTAKKWNVDIDDVLADEDFQVKLKRQQDARANVEATSNVRGSGGTSSAKDTPEYWIAKGTPPSRSEVPDRKARAKIARAFMENTKSGKKFYND